MDRTGRVIAGSRVGDVVGADDNRDVGAGELAVDIVHFLHRVVLDIGLGQQHVHMPGHPAGDGMDGELDLNAPVLKQVGQLLDGVLSLGDSKSVARHDDHLVGVRHLDGGVGGRCRLDGALVAADRSAFDGTAAEGTEHDRRNGPVHRDGHQIGQDRAGRADDHARDDHGGVVQRQTRCGSR